MGVWEIFDKKWDKKSKYVTTCLNKGEWWEKLGVLRLLVLVSDIFLILTQLFIYHPVFIKIRSPSTFFFDPDHTFWRSRSELFIKAEGVFLKIYYDFPKARNNTFYQRSRWGFLRSRPWLFSRYHQLFTIAENSFSTFCLHFLIIFRQAATKLKRKSHDRFFDQPRDNTFIKNQGTTSHFLPIKIKLKYLHLN